MLKRRDTWAHGLLGALLFAGAVCSTLAQIGGQTAADGPFTLDDAEDLDLVADGVSREWISDYVWPFGDVLSALALASSPELTLAPSQTPTGALLVTIPESFGFIDAGFGVPMPGVKGASTDTTPGNIASFTTLTFLACFEPEIPDQVFDVILESNASTDLPQIFWNYTPQSGTAFQRVEIELREPDLILDGAGLTLEQLLGNTRFLFFDFFAGPVAPGTTLTVHIDDIRLEKIVTSVSNWTLHR